MTSEIGAPSFDVVVIGGSQAGLAIGYLLAQRGRRFVILDAGPEIGDVWRSRWDSLTLFTPAQYSGLPGMAFPLPKDTYASKDDVVTYLQSYVSAFELPVRLNARVTSLTQRDGAYVVATADEEFTASQVVVATGPFQVPFVPPVAGDLDEAVFQIHSADYRNPAQLPEGGRVLVVGGGNSGFQIAEELAATRKVDLAVGKRVPSLPQRLVGKDLFWWLSGIGFMNISTDSRLGRKFGETRRAHRIEPGEASPIRRNDSEAADECCGAARHLRRRERAGHRCDRLGEGIPLRLLLDRHPNDQGRERPHHPSARGYRGFRRALHRAHLATHAGLGAHRVRGRRRCLHRRSYRLADRGRRWAGRDGLGANVEGDRMAMVEDPVCGMRIDSEEAAGTSRTRGCIGGNLGKSKAACS